MTTYPKKDRQMTLSVRLPASVVDQIDAHVAKTGTTPSAYIREAVTAQLLKDAKKKEGK